MTAEEYGGKLIELAKEEGFETDEYWGFIKIKGKVDTWYVRASEPSDGEEYGKVFVLHKNTYFTKIQSKYIPDTHQQFEGIKPPEKVIKYFVNHRKKYVGKQTCYSHERKEKLR